MDNKHTCPHCKSELTAQQYIEHLQQRIRELEMEISSYRNTYTWPGTYPLPHYTIGQEWRPLGFGYPTVFLNDTP